MPTLFEGKDTYKQKGKGTQMIKPEGRKRLFMHVHLGRRDIEDDSGEVFKQLTEKIEVRENI